MENATNCLNCGATFDKSANYCPCCGQKNTSSRLKLSEVISQFLTDYIALDSYIWKTLKLLFFAPGKLTKEFVSGKRKAYVPPFRLYIFLSFIYFFALAFTANPDTKGSEPFINLDTNPETSGLTVQIDSTKTRQAEEDSSFIKIEPRPEVKGQSESPSAIEQFFVSQANKVNKNPELFMNSLVREVSIAMFFMLPIFGALLLLFHYKREPYYVSHLIHSVHIHAFLFALFTLAIVENFITDWFGFVGGSLVSVIYLVVSIKRVYNQKLWAAILKTLIIFFLYVVILIIAAIVVLLIAIALA